MIVRNITGGAYAGPDQRVESDGTCDRPRTSIALDPDRVQEVFDIARRSTPEATPGRRSMSVDKASVYATSRLWRRISKATAAATGRRVRRRQRRPRRLRTRQIRPTARGHRHRGPVRRHPVRHRRAPGPDHPRCADPRRSTPTGAFGHGITALFEPAHGSSPHRTGTRRSNPTGAWLALATCFAWCPDLAALGLHTTVRRALDRAIEEHALTYDLSEPGQPTSDLDQFNEYVLEAIDSDPT